MNPYIFLISLIFGYFPMATNLAEILRKMAVLKGRVIDIVIHTIFVNLRSILQKRVRVCLFSSHFCNFFTKVTIHGSNISHVIHNSTYPQIIGRPIHTYKICLSVVNNIEMGNRVKNKQSYKEFVWAMNFYLSQFSIYYPIY